jgi:transposase-like protein
MAAIEVKKKGTQDHRSLARPALVEASSPNPEVKEPKKRRVLTAEWKLTFLRRFDGCKDETERGKLLRSESVYLSQVYQWKRDVKDGKLFPGGKRRRGPVSKKNREIQSLEKENARLKKELVQAKQIIELQKKIAALLGEADESES